MRVFYFNFYLKELYMKMLKNLVFVLVALMATNALASGITGATAFATQITGYLWWALGIVGGAGVVVGLLSQVFDFRLPRFVSDNFGVVLGFFGAVLIIGVIGTVVGNRGNAALILLGAG